MEKSLERDRDSLVSIIIPVYNVEPYLRQCLDSLLAQTYRNIQIICVNDGSVDDSPTILDEYAAKDSRIVVIHQENGGVSDARNKALAVCEGEWIMFCDPDDWMETQAIECMYNYVKASGCRVGMFGYRKVDDLRGVYKSMSPMHGFTQSGAYTITQDLLCTLNTACYVWNKIIKRELISKLQFAVGYTFEDVSYMLITFLSCLGERVVVYSESLYNYRQREGSILAEMKKMNMRVFDVVAEGERVLVYLKEKNLLQDCRGFALSMLAYHRNLTIEHIPEEYYPKVEKIFKGLLEKFNLKCSCLENWKYGFRSLPNIVKNLFFSIDECKVTIKLFGIPLYKISKSGFKVRIAILGIPVYRGVKKIPYVSLSDITTRF